ncbi:MAG: glycerate kinase [Deltaproteobacteria bacterium]|nr:glycerate kinase [Deltaproteobacteria bacterium]
MKIIIAPDSYKESLTALEVATEIEAGFREVFPDADFIKLPMADGGEGTVAAMVAATRGKLVAVDVTGPLGEAVKACYGLTGDGKTAVIEMAEASGLALVAPNLRNPLKTTTHGTGELIKAALDAGARHLIIGIGGSATNDGGAGMLQALGVKLKDHAGRKIGFGGGELANLDRIDIGYMDPRLKACRIEAACDVNNPLTGPDGASAVFGPQKGATPEMVAQLDANLTRYARLISRDLGIQVDSVPGAGAAGGVGAALLAFFGAELRPGIEIVVEAVGLEAAVRDADLVITGEGRIDSQTIHGKTPMGVARVAKRCGKPVIGIAGSLAPDAGVVHEHGINAVFSVLSRISTVEEALTHAAENLRTTSRNIAAALKLALDMPQKGVTVSYPQDRDETGA